MTIETTYLKHNRHSICLWRNEIVSKGWIDTRKPVVLSTFPGFRTQCPSFPWYIEQLGDSFE